MASARPGRLDPHTYRRTLLCAYAVFWLVLAIAPTSRPDWWLENLLVFAAVPLLVHPRVGASLDGVAYTLLLAFLALHAVGAHYTYSEVPYDRWAQAWGMGSIDAALGFRRNQYDRLVHFAYGLWVTPAMVALLDAHVPQRGLWRWLLPFAFMLSHSVVYELVEWGAAEVFGGELGKAYLGTQGDEWDAQKDMALAALGAALAIAAYRHWRPAGRRRAA